MVDHFLRLKLALLASAFRPGVTLLRTMGVLLLAGAVGASLLWLSAEVDIALESHRAALVIVATCVSIGIAVAPLSAGLGSAMEPRRFVAFPVAPRKIALGLGAAAAVGVPGVLAALLGISLERAWGGTSSMPAAVAAGVLGAISIVIMSQYLVVVGDQLSVSTPARRAVTAVARTVIVVALASALMAVVVVMDGGGDALLPISATLANTPMGMLWAAPGSSFAAMLAMLLAGVIMVAVLALGWGVVVSRVLESPQRVRAETSMSPLGWFDLVPATASGVIAARSLLYWTSDPRYRFVVLGLPLAPVIMMLAFAIAGAPLPPLWLLPLPVLALFLGWFIHNDVAYDHSAVWLHVASAVRGSSDRWGRAVPPLLIGLPVIFSLAPLFALWSGVDDVLPALLGTSAGLLLTGLGVSSVSSAVGAYPAARPGAGPFDQPPSLASRAGWSQALSLLAVLLLMAPTLLVVWWGFGDSEWFAVAALAGWATGVAVLLLGMALGGRAFRQRAPELLDMMLRT